MLTKVMKYVSIAALIVAALLWKQASNYELVLRFVVSVGAVMVALQATRAAKYSWAVAFYAIAVLFNPFMPTGVFSGSPALLVVLGSAVLFAASLPALHTKPRLSMPSITDRTPGSESL